MHVGGVQGKERRLNSRLSCNHKHARSPLQGLVSQMCKGQSLSAAVQVPDALEKRSEAFYISGAEQILPSVKQCGKSNIHTRDKKNGTTKCKIEQPNYLHVQFEAL